MSHQESSAPLRAMSTLKLPATVKITENEPITVRSSITFKTENILKANLSQIRISHLDQRFDGNTISCKLRQIFAGARGIQNLYNFKLNMFFLEKNNSMSVKSLIFIYTIYLHEDIRSVSVKLGNGKDANKCPIRQAHIKHV